MTLAKTLSPLLKRFAAILFGLLWAILILEILLRIGFDFLPYSTQGVIQHVRRLPWGEEHIVPPFPYILSREHQARVAPGHHNYPVRWGDAAFSFDTISLWDLPVGFRTHEPQWPVEIVALGDSFTFCWTDFEACWVERLHEDYGWSVMNLGAPGTGTLAHMSLITPYVKPLEPKIVLWQWYGNDYVDDYDLARMQESVEALRRPANPDPVPDYDWLADYSATYRLIRNWLHYQNNPRRENGFITRINDRTMFFTDQLGWFDFDYPAVEYGWGKTIETLQASRRILKDELGAELVILLIPTKEEAYGQFLLDDPLSRDHFERLSEGRRRLWNACQ
jgi:hypothetical protein